MRVSKSGLVLLFVLLLTVIVPTMFEKSFLFATGKTEKECDAKKTVDDIREQKEKKFLDEHPEVPIIDSDQHVQYLFAKKFVAEMEKMGDPVLVATGQFLFEDIDLEVPGSGFVVKRTYLSGETVIGSFGHGWSTYFDSRILRGETEVSPEGFAKLKGEVGEIEAIMDEIASFGNAPNKFTLEQLTVLCEILEASGEVYDPDKIMEDLSIFDSSELNEGIAELLEQFGIVRQAAEKLLQETVEVMDEAEELGKLNHLALYEGTPKEYWLAGNHNLVLINEGGSPVLFEANGQGEWQPSNKKQRLTMSIKSRDGGGADTKAGFILTEAGGVKKYYNGDGLLEAVEELNGNRLELVRNGQGRVTRMLGPHKNEWKVSYSTDNGLISAIEDPLGWKTQYQYTEKYLTRITDSDSVVVQYVYEDDRLKKIAKADGSFMELGYGAEREGNKLVTATTHEEGASERFDYFNGYSVHTNHSGVVTTYRYNENYQITQEEHADGTVRTYNYNDIGQLNQETVNGFQANYSYDGRDNIAQKVYSDGTREEFQWNGNDQVTRYVDRDGVVSEWAYDASGNCTNVKKGGEIIFTGIYGDKGKLLEGQEGDRAVKRYAYNDRDFLIGSVIEVNGQTIREQWEYDALGRVLKYIDGSGRTWDYEYRPGAAKAASPLGLETVYTYNNRRDLASIVERDSVTGESREKRYVYDKRHLLVEETDGAGNVTTYKYREDGELLREERGPWYWEYAYDSAGRVSAAAQGKTDSNKKYTETYGYRLQGWEEERTITKPRQGTTTYRIDPWKQTTGITNALGDSFARTFSGAGVLLREQGSSGGFFEFQYDSAGRVVGARREGERAIQVRYNRDGTVAEKIDRMGNATRYVYDGRGLLTREIRTLGEVRYQYDGADRVTRKETANRNSGVYYTEWLYNDKGRAVTVTEGGTYTETLYLNAWGEVVRRVDGEGNETRYELDGAGKIKKEIDGYGRATGYSWNEIGKLASVTYPDGVVTSYGYDHLGNMTEVRDGLGVSWAGEYDEAGRLIKETGRPGIDREYNYDQLGRITEVRNGGETVERYRYTNRGREVVFTDGEGKDFTELKNAYGELTEETNRLGDTQRRSYDAEGRLSTDTYYSGKQTKIEYRDNEGITVRTFSDGAQGIIEQDLAGNIVRVTGGTGTIRFKFDAGGKLIEQTDEGSGEVTKYTYDKAGQRVRMQSGNRDVTYRYGRNGELLHAADNSQRLEVSYEYDVRGRETRRIYGNGVRQETFYDQAGRVILIKETDVRNQLLRAEGYLYDAQGRRSHSVDDEGKVTKYEYDRQSRLITVVYPWTKEKAEADRKEAEEAGLYFTSEKGTGERHTFTGAEQTALRDLLNKASPARGNAVAGSQMIWRESYTYDRNGNRAAKTTPWGAIRYEYDAENRLAKKGDVVYNNDKDGNTLSEKGLRYEAKYEYNGQNRMVYSQVTSHAEKTHVVGYYAYDAFGRRTLSQGATGETLRTIYDGQSFEVIREGESFRDGSLTTRSAPSGAMANGAGAATLEHATGERYRWVGDSPNGRTINDDGYTVKGSRYGGRAVTLYGNGEAVAVSYSSNSGSRSMYLGKDMQGSVRSVTVGTGALEARYEYDAFGQPYTGDLGGGMNLGYTGKPYDTATGLYNYGYRDYRPQAARFTTVDPIRDGHNWFAYVNNDPVNWVDPWGLYKTGVDLNLLPSGCVPGDGYNRWAADRATRPDYAFVIAAHGDVDHIRDDVNGINYDKYNLSGLYELMTNAGYQDGQVVILNSCNTGKTPSGGGDSFARQLADYLAQKDKENGGPGIGVVMAPANYIGNGPFGGTNIGPEVLGIVWPVDPRVSSSSFMFGGMRIFISKAK